MRYQTNSTLSKWKLEGEKISEDKQKSFCVKRQMCVSHEVWVWVTVWNEHIGSSPCWGRCYSCRCCVESVYSCVSGSLSVMWNLVGFTWSLSGFLQPLNQGDWIRSVSSDNYIHTRLIDFFSNQLICFFPVSSGSSILFETVLPEQGSSLCRPTVCLCWASQ